MTDRQQPILFVSHHSSQLETAEHVERALNTQGVRCWIAPRDIDPGEPFDRAVRNAIADSDAVLLLFSSASEKSRHVKRELILADQVGKAIIPLRLERIKPGELSYHLADSQWIDWLEKRDDAIARIAAKAREFHEHSPFEAPESTTDYAPPPFPPPAAFLPPVDVEDAAPAHSEAIGAGADLQPQALGAFAGPSIDAPAPPPPLDHAATAEPGQKRSLLWLWIALAALVLVGGGVALTLFLMRGSSNTVTEAWFEGQWSDNENCTGAITRFGRDNSLSEGTQRGTWSIDNGNMLHIEVNGISRDVTIERVDEDTVEIDDTEYYRCH